MEAAFHDTIHRLELGVTVKILSPMTNRHSGPLLPVSMSNTWWDTVFGGDRVRFDFGQAYATMRSMRR